MSIISSKIALLVALAPLSLYAKGKDKNVKNQKLAEIKQAAYQEDKKSLRVSPMSFEIFDKNGGKEQSFEITAFTGKPSILKAKLVRLVQNLDGSLASQNIPENDPILKTVKFAETSKTFPISGIWLIEGLVNVNSDAFKKGEILGVAVKEAPLGGFKEIKGAVATSGITVSYIVLLKMNPGLKDKKPRGEIVFNGLKKDKGQLYIETSFESKNAFRAHVQTEVTIRDKNGKTVDKSFLLTQVAIRSNKRAVKKAEDVVILPNSKILLLGDINGIKTPGKYQISIVSTINGQAASVFNHVIDVSQEFLDNSKFLVNSNEFKIDYVAGAVKSNPLEIVNPSDSPVNVELQGAGKISDELGQYGWARTSFVLPAHSKKTADFRSINLKGPMSVEGVRVVFKDNNGKVLQTNDIKVEFVVKAEKAAPSTK